MKQARNTPQTRAQLTARFKVLCMDAGLNVEAVGKLLHVTPRTVRYWFAGKTAVPYASYKLLRILARYELPGAAWAGWHMHSGRLWSPEGHGFEPHDSNWWGLLVRKAALFTELYDRNRKLENLLLAGGRSDAPAPGMRQRPQSGSVEAVPSGEAGRAPQAPRPNLLLEHFRTQHVVEAAKTPAVRGETQNWLNPSYKVKISYGGKQGMRP